MVFPARSEDVGLMLMQLGKNESSKLTPKRKWIRSWNGFLWAYISFGSLYSGFKESCFVLFFNYALASAEYRNCFLWVVSLEKFALSWEFCN